MTSLRSFSEILMAPEDLTEVAERLRGQRQHLRRRVHAGQPPARARLGKGLELHPAACAEDPASYMRRGI